MEPPREVPRTLTIVVLAAGGVTVLGLLGFMLVPLELPPGCGFSAPILCGELPSSGATLTEALGPPNDLATWRANVWLDFPFLVAYAALLAAAALRERAHQASIARAAAATVIVGALFDVSENAGLLLAIDAVGEGQAIADSHAAWIRVSAYLKFAVLGAGCAATAGLVARATPAIGARLLYAGIAAVALLTLVGALADRVLEVGAIGIVLTCLAAFVRAARDLRGARARRPAA